MVDRKSTFQAHLATVTSKLEVINYPMSGFCLAVCLSVFSSVCLFVKSISLLRTYFILAYSTVTQNKLKSTAPCMGMHRMHPQHAHVPYTCVMRKW